MRLKSFLFAITFMFSVTAYAEDGETNLPNPPPAIADQEIVHSSVLERRYWAGVDAEVYHAYFSGNQSLFTRTVQVRPKVHGEYFFKRIPFSIGGEFSSYSEPGLVNISRSELLARVGYWWDHQALGLVLSAGYTTTGVDRFESSTANQVGLSAHYRVPVQMLEVDFSLGWSFQSQVTLYDDSGIPQTSDPFENALCSAFTFGLSNGCGNSFTKITVPPSNTFYVGIGIGI